MFGKRGDQVPLVLAQSTPSNERLCSLLSALLLRQPAPPLSNRLPWQLVDHHHPQARRKNIQLVVISEEGKGHWPNGNFIRDLKDYTSPSVRWFCWELNRDHSRFQRRWSQWMSTLSTGTDVYVVVGSESALKQVSRCLTDQETAAIVKGILSVLPYSENRSTTSDKSLPHIPDGIFHWIIQTHAPVSVSHQGALVVAGHGSTICQTLSCWPPSPWLVRAAVWFASASQTIQTDSEQYNAQARARL